MATMAGANRFYSRYGNPTVQAFEDAIAELEGADAARAFASGMGALSTVVLGLCSTGDHIVAQRQIYAGTQLLLQTACARASASTSPSSTAPSRCVRRRGEARAHDARHRRDAGQPAARPGRPRRARGEIARSDHGGRLHLRHAGRAAARSTTASTSCCTRPPKAIAGHNDATLGVIAGERELLDDIWKYSVLHGACASPFDAWNGLRGIRTLPVRFARQSDSALRLAEFLHDNPAVSQVNYPGLASHPQHELAKRQMRRFGGLLSFECAGGLEAGRRFVEGVELAQMASSLGGPETLVNSPANSTHVGISRPEARGGRHQRRTRAGERRPRARRRPDRRLQSSAEPPVTRASSTTTASE